MALTLHLGEGPEPVRRPTEVDAVAASLLRLRAHAAQQARPWRQLQRRSRALRASSSAALDRLVAVRLLARDAWHGPSASD